MMKLEAIKPALRAAKQGLEVEHPTQTLRATEAAAEEKLVQCLQRQQPIAIAVSGGVDSLTWPRWRSVCCLAAVLLSFFQARHLLEHSDFHSQEIVEVQNPLALGEDHEKIHSH